MLRIVIDFLAITDKKVLECEGNSGEFVELVPEQLNYLGPKDLTQYFIRSSWRIRSS